MSRRTGNEILIENEYNKGKTSIKYKMTIVRTNTLDIHKKKVNAMNIDNMRRLLFTAGEDKKLNIIDYETLKPVGSLKTSNARLRAMAINEELKRLYASSCEG